MAAKINFLRSRYLPPSEMRAVSNYEAAEAARHAELVGRVEAHASDLIRYHGHGILWASVYVGRDRRV